MPEDLSLTHVTLREHLEAVQREREKAMALAREYQTYKDEQANDLRKQLGEWGASYASRRDLEDIKGRLDRMEGSSAGMKGLLGIVGAVGALILVLLAVFAFVDRAPDAFPATINSERTVVQPQ